MQLTKIILKQTAHHKRVYMYSGNCLIMKCYHDKKITWLATSAWTSYIQRFQTFPLIELLPPALLILIRYSQFIMKLLKQGEKLLIVHVSIFLWSECKTLGITLSFPVMCRPVSPLNTVCCAELYNASSLYRRFRVSAMKVESITEPIPVWLPTRCIYTLWTLRLQWFFKVAMV